ncbi:ribosomal L32p protein family-domain-containing protein, partial [Melampsora americana]
RPYHLSFTHPFDLPFSSDDSPATNSSSSSISNSNSFIQWGQRLSNWISEYILKAVPKKKVSHSRKRMRSAHKGIKLDLGLSTCPACGQTKRKHHLCLECYAEKVLEYNRGDRKPWDKGITP